MAASQPLFVELAPGVSCFRDTCNVYVLVSGRDAVLVDFGSGDVVAHLADLGVERVTDVLVTHHHRDQIQGLGRAVAAGARVWVPPVERDLVAGVADHWERRRIANDYDLRQDRFSILEPVAVDTVAEYRTQRYGRYDVYALPTPGHTAGSLTYLVETDGRRLAFTGDLVYAEGKVWSLAATQWSYSGTEGQAATIVSCRVLGDRDADLLLPSHGPPIEDPGTALAALRAKLQELVDLRREEPWDLDDLYARPWVPVTPHLLRNRASFASSYVLVSTSGAALVLDFGYDVTTGLVPSTERTARRPLLWPFEALRRDHGIRRIEAVLPTHYHDDHVAGLELLRDVEGAEVWASSNVAPILENPSRYDLPCLWFEPILVDRAVPLGVPITWHEYELTLHALPGHTLYAIAVELEVDGLRVLLTGDQQTAGERPILNYQYRNRFRIDDYVASAELYRARAPDLLVSGHWLPQEVDARLLDRLSADGQRLAALHRELLPLEDVDFGAEGFAARIEPYTSVVTSRGLLELEVTVRNPFAVPEVARVELVLPSGWRSDEPVRDVPLPAGAEATAAFNVSPNGAPPSARARIAVDVTVGDHRFGEQAEALVRIE